MGVVVYLLWSFSFFMNFAGERLELEKAVPRYRRPGTPNFSVGCSVWSSTDIWRLCRFLGALFRALRTTPGGIGRQAQAYWMGKVWTWSHVYASEDFLNELSVLFRSPSRSAAAL